MMSKIDALLTAAALQKASMPGMSEGERATFDTMLATLGKICASVHATAIANDDHANIIPILEKYLKLDEGRWDLRAKLAESHLRAGSATEAARHYRHACESQSGNDALHFGLGVALMRSGRKAEAAAAFEQAHAINPANIGAANNLANLLAEQGEHARAIPFIVSALAHAPAHPQLLWTMALLSQESGDLDASRMALETLLSINPDHAEAYRLLGLQSRFERDDPRLVAMREAFARTRPGSQPRIALGFALFRAEDQLQAFDAAWHYLDEANRARFALAPFDIDATRRRLRLLETIYTPEFIERFKGGGCEDTAPVFIVGLPRSGTSLTEQIVASHPSVHGAGELDLLHTLNKTVLTPGWDTDPAFASRLRPEQFRQVGVSYLDHLRRLSGNSAVHIDKMPANFMLLGLIRLALPKARIIHCRREPLASCFALYTSYLPSPAQGYSFDLEQIGAYYLAYNRLMAHWHDVMGDAIHTLDHDALVADQEGETRKLLDFIGLDFDPACLDFHQSQRAVRTLSATQIRQGLTKGTNDKVFNYIEYLAPMIRILVEGGVRLPERAVQRL